MSGVWGDGGRALGWRAGSWSDVGVAPGYGIHVAKPEVRAERTPVDAIG